MKKFLLPFLVTLILLLGGRTAIMAQPAAPTNVTATPSTINLGSSSNLKATSTGNQINWYNVSSGGSLLKTVNSGENYSVTPAATTTYYAETNQSASETALPLAPTWKIASKGIFFDITNKSTSTTITKIRFQRNGGVAGHFYFYYKIGSHIGSETISANWSSPEYIKATQYTPYPDMKSEIDINDITIPANTTYGFYIFGDTDDLGILTTKDAVVPSYSDSRIIVTSGKGSRRLWEAGDNYIDPSNSSIANTSVGSIVYAETPSQVSSSRTPVNVTVNQLPGAPTGVTASAGNEQASVSFTPPASNGGSAITGYRVTSSPGGFTGSGSSSPIIVSGLTNGTAYTFTVTATNSVGTGLVSAASLAVTPAKAPTVTTPAVSNITATTATVTGNVTDDGGATVTDRGVCWSTSTTPTTANSKTTDGTNTGLFTSGITGLAAGTLYYVRAYAINSEGTSYGDVKSFTTLKLSQTITFGALPTKIYGNADFAPGAIASSELTVSYSTSNSAIASVVSGKIHIVGVGSCTVYANQAGNSAYYTASQKSQSLIVNKATPTVTAWPTTADITYGDALSMATLSGGTVSVAGVFAYDAPTVKPIAGTYSAAVTFTPTDTDNYNAVMANVNVTVAKATPTVTWANPSDIVYGIALSAAELNATSPVAGTFVYTPALTTILDAGAGQTLSVEFTPDDAANYNTSTATVTINVTKATPVITWADPSDIVYGTALSAAELNATSPVAGTFVYTPALSTILDAGAGQTLSVAFTPSDAANYNTSTATVTINVTKATPVITWADPSDIVYGTALSATELNATSPVAGAFVYTPALSTLLDAGSQTLSVAFTPDDAVNYNTNTATVTINVTKATPVITWADPSDIVYGTALSATELNATSPVAGTFVYTPALSTVLDAGAGQILSVAFTPSDAVNYNTNTATATINVTKATPSITWADPSDIVYGTALSATELNATSPVAGTFVYTPALSTILDAGAGQTLSVAFTPSDAVNYTTNTATATINVTKATPTVTWANPSDIVYGTALSAAELNATSPVAGTFVYTPALTTILDAGAGQTLSVAFTPSDAVNYTTNTATATINVTKATPTITWADPSDIVYGTALSATELNATSPVAGTFVYTPALNTLLDAGAGQTLSVAFTPDDGVNYNTNTATATINVTKATPVITWANPSDIVYGTALSAAELNATSPIAGAFVYTPALSTLLDAGAGQTLSVAFTPDDGVNYNTNTSTATINVTKATPTVTWADPSDIVYGTALSAAELNATSPIAGAFVYTPALNTLLDAGAGQILSVAFTPSDGVNYNTNTATVTINVTKATPTVSAWPTTIGISHGDDLSSATLSGGIASVAGSFAYDDNTITPNVGIYSAALTFTPTDATNYNAVAGNIDVSVKDDQIITFDALVDKTTEDADFNPGATSSLGLEITYTSSNDLVATIVNNQVHIVGAGTTNIIASQLGNNTAYSASPVEQSLTVVLATGIKEPELVNFNIYPNPASDNLNVEIEKTSKNESVVVSIIDLNGTVVYNEVTKNSICKISVSDYKAGLYFVKLTTKAETKYKKLIIIK